VLTRQDTGDSIFYLAKRGRLKSIKKTNGESRSQRLSATKKGKDINTRMMVFKKTELRLKRTERELQKKLLGRNMKLALEPIRLTKVGHQTPPTVLRGGVGGKLLGGGCGLGGK